MSVARLSLRHPGGTTPVLAGEGALVAFASEIEAWVDGRTVFLVTTPRVWGLHGEALLPTLSTAAAVSRLEVPEGEAAKSMASAERLWSRMLAAGGKRDSRVVAFGGGSVGDLAGFAAGCFVRASPSYSFRLRCWRRSMPRSAARRGSTCRRPRTAWACSTIRGPRSLRPDSWRRFRAPNWQPD